VEALWRVNDPFAHFQTVDVTLRTNSTNAEHSQPISAAPEDSTQRFFARYIALGVASPRFIKLILSRTPGFLPRKNFFERRLVDFPFAEEIVGFSVLEREIKPCVSKDDFCAILGAAAAGIVLPADQSAAAEGELLARLNLRWLLSSPAPRYHVVLVEGYPHLQMGIGFIQAVKDLNVRLIVLGPQGQKHWLEDPENAAGFCEALIHVDLTFDARLPERIAAAVRGYKGWDKADGIFTAHDRYLVATAQAARILELPAAPARAHEISTDKYAMRQFQADDQANDFQLFRFAGVDDARQHVDNAVEPFVVHYPAIVKPISGFASEGVAKVNNNAELFNSIARVNSARHGNVVIVETYIPGPEFDANFVLMDGKILFFELTDDFPSEGDLAGAGSDAAFFETGELTPSNLSPAEREIVRSSLHKTLLDLGFTWGLYHIEGRLKDSAKEYRADETGLVDLQDRISPASGKPSCFLLEINARVPGVGCSFSTIHTYGVDFYAVPVLACVRDTARLSIIATPFSFPSREDGSQYWCQVVFIQPTHGGTYVSEDACGALINRRPDL
ncbi:carnosine synthase 1 protein, partial [Favolaschia claudopus]